MRNTIFFAKKDLKGKGVAITEHLSQDTLKKLSKAKELFGKHNVWTSQTKVKALVHHRTYHITSIGYAYRLQDWADHQAESGERTEEAPSYAEGDEPVAVE